MKLCGPQRVLVETASLRGAKGVQRRVIGRGWAPPRIKDNAKLFWLLCDICAQFGRCEVQNSSMVPQGHLHHIPIVARGKIYPRAVRNGSLRREGAAEAAFRGLGSRSAFFKNFVFSPNIVVGQRRRSPDLTTKWRARSAPFS